MRFRERFTLYVVLLLAALAMTTVAVVAQDEPATPSGAAAVDTLRFDWRFDDIFAVAAAFDVKYQQPDYIAYSGMEAITQQALAVHVAGTFDIRLQTPGVLAYRPLQADALVAQLAQEEMTKAMNYGLTPAEDELFAHESCFDRRYFLAGHVTCHTSG